MIQIAHAPREALAELQTSVDQLTAYMPTAEPLIWYETDRLCGWIHAQEQGSGHDCFVHDVPIEKLRDDQEKAAFLAMAIDRSSEGCARAEIQLVEACSRLGGTGNVSAALLQAANLRIKLSIGDLLNGVRVRVRRDASTEDARVLPPKPDVRPLSNSAVIPVGHVASKDLLTAPLPATPPPVEKKHDVLQPERTAVFPDHPLLRGIASVRRIANHANPAISELANQQNIAVPIVLSRLLETANERPNTMPELLMLVREACVTHLPETTDYAAMVRNALMYIQARFPKQVHDFGRDGKVCVMWRNTNGIGRYTD